MCLLKQQVKSFLLGLFSVLLFYGIFTLKAFVFFIVPFMAAKSQGPEQISLGIPYREKVSRLFIFRFLWMFPLVPLVWVWTIWIALVAFLQFFYMLILGKKEKFLWTQLALFFAYTLRWNAYFHVLVDERPGLFDFEVL